MFKLILKGMAIGVANIIPGVSGGTIAVILGLYEKITEAIGNFFLVSMQEKIKYLKFLVNLGIGGVLGILLFAKIIKFSILNYPNITMGIFTILIIPSIPYIVRGENKKDIKNIIFFVLGLIFMGGFVYLNLKYGDKNISHAIINENITKSYLIKLFLCGSISAGAMIIPGISGSMLLLVLGEYYNILGFINDFKILPLFIFALGMALGLVVIAKIINIFLTHYKSETLFFIAGIMIISIIQIWIV